ncbi:hypothetical protein EVAR_68614_1 [Eumeta japonica]|uniref:Uncharacterized protein n=1 Tax=Eumeta variegata TaxID=151549 RepID=A0A4C1ZND6_EUMVA|nr:hypothetical protein EVAR_68614_1 [Eumeta japonica]
MKKNRISKDLPLVMKNGLPRQECEKMIMIKGKQALQKGIIHYELLPPSKTINSDVYCQQLMKLKEEVEKIWLELINRKGVVFITVKLDIERV